MKSKKQMLIIIGLSMVLTASLMMVDYMLKTPLRNCITDVQSSEANLKYEDAKEICQQIGELNSIDTN